MTHLSELQYGWVYLIWFAVLGGVVGSFVNVFVYRWPIMQRLGKYADGIKLADLKSKHGRFNLMHPRSSCPCCGIQIMNRHNVPVLGWLLLRGKCRSCREPISPQYLMVELLFATAFATYTWFEGLSVAGALSYVMMAIGYCIVGVRFETGVFDRRLIALYAVVLLAQMILTAGGLGEPMLP